MMMEMINYLFNFEKFIINDTVWPISKWIFMVKMNSLPGSNMWYSVTICIDLIQIKLNSWQQTKYHSYLIERSPEKGKLKNLKK